MRPASLPLFALTLIAAGCGEAKKPDDRPVQAEAGGGKPLPQMPPFAAEAGLIGRPPEPVTWTDIGEKPAEFGGLLFSLVPAERRLHHDTVPALLVGVLVKNTTADRRFTLKGWGYDRELVESLGGKKVSDPGVGRESLAGVELLDDAGAKYRPMMRFLSFGKQEPVTLRERVIGLGEQGGIAVDFERPTAAKSFRLTIPGSDVGLIEPVRLSFPASKIADAKPAPPKK